MGAILSSFSQQDLCSVFRSRIVDESDSAVIGFYDRSLRSWTTQRQADFLRRSTDVATQLIRAGGSPRGYVVVAASSPEATLLGFAGSILADMVPTILPIRPAFDGRGAIAQRIENAMSLLGTNTLTLVEHRNDKPIVQLDHDIHALALLPESIVGSDDPGNLPSRSTGPICHVQLTSGSTGTGKGVAVTHSSLLANITALRERIEVTPYDVFISWLPLYHDMGLVSKAMLPLVLGVDTYLMSPFDFLSDPHLWLRAISDHRGTVTASPTFGYNLVTKKVTDQQLSQLDLSSWKSAYCGAEPISADVARAFYARFAPCGLPTNAFTPSYGLAEATLAVTGIRTRERWRSLRVTQNSLSRLDEIEISDESDGSVEVVALGAPVDGLQLSLVDGDGHMITDELACGEIVVDGSSVAAGWLHDGGVLQPFDENGLHTGDIGFFHDGELFVVDRIKNIVIRNGHNYSAQVLEQTLASLAGVEIDDVIVIDRDIANGTGLTGVVELPKKISVAQPHLDAVLSGIDRFEPPLESIVFVRAGSLPRTTSGKKRHIAVRELLNNDALALLARHDMHELPLATAGQEIALDLATLEGQSQVTFESSSDEQELLELVSGHVRSRGLDIPVTMASRLQHDLDFDSLGLLDLAMHAEENYSIQLSQGIVANLKTVRDLALAVNAARDNTSTSTGGLAAALKRLKERVPQYYTVVDDVKESRQILVEGRWMTDFGSCGYLGLEDEPDVLDAIDVAHRKWGLQRWSTRAVGLARPVLEIERRLASLIGVPDTMVFGTITLLHIGVLPILAGNDGVIVIDTAAHTSMQEAAALARGKGTSVVPFKHGCVEDLRMRLEMHRDRARRIIVLDGIYSMSGAALDVRTYQTLAEEYDAMLYIDDAHGFGVVGEYPTQEQPLGHRGNGIVRHSGCDYNRIIYVGGLGKAYSTSMGFVSCPTPEYRNLFHSASTTIFGHLASTSVLAQVDAVLDINERDGEQRRERLCSLLTQLADGVEALGYEIRSRDSAVLNVIVGDIESLITATNVLWEDGIKITPAMFPAVPLDEGGLRFTVTATNTPEQVDQVLKSLTRLRPLLDIDLTTSKTSVAVP